MSDEVLEHMAEGARREIERAERERIAEHLEKRAAEYRRGPALEDEPDLLDAKADALEDAAHDIREGK